MHEPNTICIDLGILIVRVSLAVALGGIQAENVRPRLQLGAEYGMRSPMRNLEEALA